MPEIEAPIFLSHAIFVVSAKVRFVKKYGNIKKITPYNREKKDIGIKLFLIIIKF